MSIEPSAAARTEVGPVETAAMGPDQTAAPMRAETRRFAAFSLDTSSRTFELKTVLLGADTDESTGQKTRR
jgi:hypothetical protein